VCSSNSVCHHSGRWFDVLVCLRSNGTMFSGFTGYAPGGLFLSG
jgi:hypothetical protein